MSRKTSNAVRDEHPRTNSQTMTPGEANVLREHFFKRVFERKIEGLGRKVTDAICEVPVPESLHTLLLEDALAAVNDARIPGDLAAPDLRIGILGLHDKFDPLDRCGQRLCDRAREAAENEIEEETLEV